MPARLLYTFILHQTTTVASCSHSFWKLLYTFILHQTTTSNIAILRANVLLYTFILHQTTTICDGSVWFALLLYTFILHQTTTQNGVIQFTGKIALYLYSTSNHNIAGYHDQNRELLYTFILHQTTTKIDAANRRVNCFIPLFYIKPQLLGRLCWRQRIALYLYSTSNHNIYFLIYLLLAYYEDYYIYEVVTIDIFRLQNY